MALSYLLADVMGKALGDEVLAQGSEGDAPLRLRIVGICQDITNGGKTAQAVLNPEAQPVKRYTLYVSLRSDGEPSAASEDLAALLPTARVTPVAAYVSQTFGGTLRQLRSVSALALSIAVILCALISVLLVHMLLSRDRTELAVTRAIGLSKAALRYEYLVMLALPAGLGVLCGLLLESLLGSQLLRAVAAPFGIVQLNLQSNPWLTILLVPSLCMASALASATLQLRTLGQSSLVEGLRR